MKTHRLEPTGFFDEAEKYFGLIDKDGEPKLGWTVWKEMTQQITAGDSGIANLSYSVSPKPQ